MGRASSSVPCGACSMCCFHQQVVVLPGDDANLDVVPEIVPGAGRRMVLRRRQDGGCVYLGEHGCSIYERRPRICRETDCRDHYFLSANQRRAREAVMNEHDKAIARRGRELVERARS